MGAEPLFESPDESHWTTLGEVCRQGGGDVQTGPFGSQLHRADYVLDGTPAIMPTNIGADRVDATGIARVSDDDLRRLARYRVRLGDIVYSRRGDVERRALVGASENGWLCGTGCLRVRFGQGVVEPRYAYYYLGHPDVREWVVRHAVGETMANLNTEILSALPFLLPTLERQRAIAAVLGSLDDKSDLNRRMNATLEATARAIFKAWFVDFEDLPVEAGRREPVAMVAEAGVPFGRQPARSDLPGGWTSLSLDRLAEFRNGLALQRFPPVDGEPRLPVIKIAQMRTGRPSDEEFAAGSLDPAYVVEDGDVLFSWSGSLEVCLWTGGRGALNQHLFKVSSAHAPKWCYLLWTKHHLPSFREIAANKATTMGHIQRHHLTEAEVLLPPKGVMDAMGRVLGPIIEEQVRLGVETRSLEDARDTLLPKLLSGEVRVKGVA
jgi:type I restriction enzyme S subunit